MFAPLKKVRTLFSILGSTRFLVRRLQRRFITKETKDKQFPVVVDVGCGTAPHRKFISYEKYIGVDVEDRGGVPDAIIADVNQGIPLPGATADLVVCSEVLEHTKKPAFVIKELFRITKPGGMVLLTTPMVWPLHEVPNDYYRYTEFGLAFLFRDAGFREVTTFGSNGYCYTMCALFVLRLRHPIFVPIVLLINGVGYVVGRIEQSRDFPLGTQAVALK